MPENQKPDHLFHAHLDKCKHCNENPMNLCQLGMLALKATVGQPITAEDTRPRMDILDIQFGEEAGKMRTVAQNLPGTLGQLMRAISTIQH